MKVNDVISELKNHLHILKLSYAIPNTTLLCKKINNIAVVVEAVEI